MSLTLNMVGGGGGGGLSSTDALLRVQAPGNSIVTITKGTTTKSDQGHENAGDSSVYDYYFIIHASQFDSVTPWSVSATDPIGIVNTKTITIDAPDEYDLTFACMVPDGYQEVVSLAVGGTAGPYIDTGFVAGSDWLVGTTEFTLTCMYTGNTTGDAFGAFTGNSNATWNRFYVGYRNSNTDTYIGMGNDSAGDLWGSFTIANNTKYNFVVTGSDTNLTAQLINYNSGAVIKTVTDTSRQPPANASFALFAGHNVDNSSYNGPTKYFMVYYLKFVKNSAVKAEFIPCYRISDSVAGFYERVSGAFLTNIGTGSFIVGSDVNR